MNQSNKPASINQERSQWINRALILNLLRQEGICSRATLSRLSGLKQATITNIAGELIQCGLVVETGLIAGAKGRRSIGVTLNDARYKVVGIRMTRDQFYVSLVGISGKMYEIRPYRIEAEETPQSILSRIRAAIGQLDQEYPKSELLAACLAMPGPYREDLDRLLFVTERTGWQNFPIHAVLSEGLEMPLYVLNDAKASPRQFKPREPSLQASAKAMEFRCSGLLCCPSCLILLCIKVSMFFIFESSSPVPATLSNLKYSFTPIRLLSLGSIYVKWGGVLVYSAAFCRI